MTRQISVRFYCLVLGALAVALVSLVSHRPALAALSVALAAPVVVATVGWRWPQLDIEVRLSSPRVVEGDELHIVIELSSDSELPLLDVEVEPAVGLRSVDGLLRRVVRVPASSARVVRVPVVPTTWGVLGIGRYRVVGRDRFGLFSVSTIRTIPGVLRVYPSEARLRGMASPERTSDTLGAHLASSRGDGCEYADVRAWQPGDRMRMVNWRVSARRGATWVTERHPERAADAVIVLDDTAAIGPAEDSTLRRAVQAAMALAEGHLAAQDRVGFLALGAPLRWVRPRSGPRQLYAIVDTLLDCRLARLSGLGRNTSVVLGGLRPGTTIVALSVLSDDRVVEMLADLRHHGHQVVTLLPIAETGAPTEGSRSLADVLATRLWERERDDRRARLEASGVPVVSWDGVSPLGGLLRRARVGARAT